LNTEGWALIFAGLLDNFTPDFNADLTPDFTPQ